MNDIIATIGTYTLTEDTDFSPGQEFAGAVETVRVPAGEYPVEIRRSSYNRQPYFCIPLPGTLTYSAWFGSNTRITRPMTPRTHHKQPYGFQLRQDDRVKLDADAAARVKEAFGYDAL